MGETFSLDYIIDKSLKICKRLPENLLDPQVVEEIEDLNNRFSSGVLRIAVLGQFNRGKSSFINKLLENDILPTSVLPVTSIPIIVSYGDDFKCIVSFFDEKEDVVGISKDNSQELLLKYATEAKNPENVFNVSEVNLQCKSEMLSHGTVLIDTPGFGSTNIHNTDVTIDYLSSCDAALFVFSADLPITQLEIEFLQDALRYVSRVFFIYNKIDLLTEEDLSLSERFIKTTLIDSFNFDEEVKLFPVSCNEKGGKVDPLYFSAVKDQIITFLHSEKYFALSEAINEKLKNALTEIRLKLLDRVKKIKRFDQSNSNRLEKIQKCTILVKKESKKTVLFSEVEQKALREYCGKKLVEHKDSMVGAFFIELRRVAEKISTRKADIDQIDSMIRSSLYELFAASYEYIVKEINIPLSNASDAHLKQLRKITNLVERKLHIDVQKLTDDITDIPLMSIEVSSWKPQLDHVSFEAPKLSFMSKLTKRGNLFDQLKSHYADSVKNELRSGLNGLAEQVNLSILESYKNFLLSLYAKYKTLHQLIVLEQKQELKKQQYKEEKVKPELLMIREIIAEIDDILKMLF